MANATAPTAEGAAITRQTANEFAANFRLYEVALRLNQERKNLTLLSYSYCITGISLPVVHTE